MLPSRRNLVKFRPFTSLGICSQNNLSFKRHKGNNTLGEVSGDEECLIDLLDTNHNRNELCSRASACSTKSYSQSASLLRANNDQDECGIQSPESRPGLLQSAPDVRVENERPCFEYWLEYLRVTDGRKQPHTATSRFPT